MFPFTLNQLRILKAVALEQNFTKAAAKLYLSQSSLSKRITTLENNLGIKLIKRYTNYVLLTKKGTIFLKYSERILALCEESCRILAKPEKTEDTELKVGINQAFGAHLLSRLLVIGSQKDTKLNLKLMIDSTENLTTQLMTQNLDLVLTSAEIYNFLSEEVKMKVDYYMSDPIYLILSNLHQFAKQKTINKKELYTLNYITLEPNRRNYMSFLLQLNQIDISKFKTVLYLDSIESVKIAVKLGLGASFISSLAIEREINLEMLKIIKIHKIKMNQKVFLLTTQKCNQSTMCTLFYNKLFKLRKIPLRKLRSLKKI